MQYKYAEIADTVYFWFAANGTDGAAGDGASAAYDVRLAGAAANAAPTASGSPTLLSHANYSDGLYEIAIDTTGYAAGEYAVFCTLTISTVNPAGFCGSFKLRAAGTPAIAADLKSILGHLLTQTGTQVADAFQAFFDVAAPTGNANSLPAAVPGANGGLPTTNGTKVSQTVDLTAGQTIAANLTQILGTALTETSGLIAAAFKKFFNVATPTGTANSLPDAVPGAAGGLFIAGTNAATTITTSLTTTFTGNLTGTVAKSPATLAAADVSGNLPADVKAWNGGALPVPAVAGDKMDLIDAPNATAITAVQTSVKAITMADGDTLAANSWLLWLRRMKWMLTNKMAVVDADGTYTLYKDNGTTSAATGSIADDSTTTTRSTPTWA